MGNNHTNYHVSWFYGMTLLGDPTINFRHQVNDVCVKNRTLTALPSDNHSKLRLLKAGHRINNRKIFMNP